MQTRQDLIYWIALRERDMVRLNYELIDARNFSEIATSIRILRGYFWDFEQRINSVKEDLKNKQRLAKETSRNEKSRIEE